MSFNNKKLFNGKINTQNVYDINKQIDYKVQDLEGRKKVINGILSNRDADGLNFFEVYFDEYYKAEATQSDALSENDNVCKSLEQMADYLLGSTEVREDRRDKDNHYRFFVDKNEYNRVLRREESIENKCTIAKEKAGFDNGEHVINFLLKKPNYLKPKRQTITEEDLKEESFCGEVLRAYNDYNTFLSNKLSQPDNNSQGYKIRKIKGEIAADMIYTKDTLNYIFGYNLRNQLFSSTVPNWDYFDWSNIDQVRALININCEFIPNDDLSMMVFDLNELIKEMHKKSLITEKEYLIYRLIKQGYKNIEISKMLCLQRSSITNAIHKFATKISEYALQKGY